MFATLTRWAWAPAPVLLFAMFLLWAADWRTAYVAPPQVLLPLQFVFMTLVSVAVGYLASRTFLADGSSGFLLLVCGALAWGLSGVLAASVSRGDMNVSVTIHNLCVWLSAFCHLTGVALPVRSDVAPARRIWALLGGATATIGVILLIAVGAVKDWAPTFFVQGQGGTLIRQTVLSSAIAMFVASALMLLARTVAPRSPFRRWYGVGLFLVALGLFGVLIQAVHSSVLGWTGVGTQWLGSCYLLAAVFAAVSQSGPSPLSLSGRPQDRRVRYAVAIVFMFAGGSLTLLLVRHLDPYIAYLALYPVVILAALYGGRGPGLLAALVLAIGVDVLWPDPLQSVGGGEASAWLARTLFVASSVCMVLVVNAMQTARAATVRAELEVTAQKRAEEALKASNQAKDEFLAMLGHELRNPLGAIASATSLLGATGAAGHTADRARAVIVRQVQLLSRLVDDLLDVSRVTSGKIALERRPLDLGELVTNTVNGWRSSDRLERHRIAVEVSPVWVDADETRIEQVVSNLVGNALKYTPAGGTVAVRIRPDGDTAVLEVEDTGVGIPAPLIGRVFDLFVQGERTIDRAQGGLGIGLTLVKALVEMHGGTVEATSGGQDRGSTFRIRLPRVAARPRPEPLLSPSAPERPRCRILVIEDNADARDMLRSQLELEGHDVHEASDGSSGVAAVPVVAPDIALIDLGLPTIDGYEVARRIRATAVGRSMVLIALTGYGQAEDRRRALEAGFDAHLTKPVLPQRLAEVIANSRRHAAR